MADFTGKKIKDTYTRVVQYHNGTLKDGLGFAISASVGSLSGSLSGSFEGHFSGSLTGSFSGTFDGATSSSFASRIATQESFSSSLDATYATDADLNLVSSSVDSLNAATSSYALAANISGSNVILSSSLANRIASQESFSSSLDATFATDAELSTVSSSLAIETAQLLDFSSSLNNTFATDAELSTVSSSLVSTTDTLSTRISAQESFSSSLDTTFATDAEVSTAVSSLNSATSSYALSANISGSFTELSSSIATRITGNDTDISNLQSFSSSLDATFATDADLNLISSSVDSINAATSSYIDNTSVQSIGGAKTFTDNVIVNNGASLTIADGDITSTHTSSSLSQNYYRIQMRGESLAVSQSHSVRANISAQGLADGGTFANIYGTRVDLGAFNDKSGSNQVNIGNLYSASVNLFGADDLMLRTKDTGCIDLISSHVSASANLIVSGTIESNNKANKIRFHYDTLGDLPSATVYHGMFAHVHGEASAYYAHGGSWIKLADDTDKVNNSATASFITNSETGSFASTDSNTFTGNQIISSSALLTLQPSPTAPAGVSTGSLIISGSTPQLYIFNGSGSTGWNRV